jgi:hypothetical protein
MIEISALFIEYNLLILHFMPIINIIIQMISIPSSEVSVDINFYQKTFTNSHATKFWYFFFDCKIANFTQFKKII